MASALITVASIPIESAVARSMPLELAAVPRMMFPPPITIPSSTPSLSPSWISRARRSSATASRPCPCSPASTSPLSFRRTRRREGLTRSVLSDAELGEAAHDDVLAQLRDGLVHEILHLPLRIADRRLLQETDLLVVLVDLSLDDLREDRLGLPGAARLLRENGTLALDQ